ncbi:MAG: hypothetical protein ABIP50_02390 [Candidatus Saccharimonadales bacterium]
MANTYIPGMCNIGPAERRMRRIAGILGAVVTLALLALLVVNDVSIWWRLILIIPAAGSATGFLQDAMHFCAAFGMRGMYNVINSAGVVDNVELEEYRLKDRRKALQIVLLSGVIGIVFAGLTLLINV